MKTFAARFPFVFALGITVIAMLCLLWPFWVPGLSQSVQILLGRAAICLFAIGMLTHLGWWREAGFVSPSTWRILLPYLPVFLLIALAKTSDLLTVGIQVTELKLILLGLLVYLSGGFMEEAVFRGLVLRALLPRGLVRAAVLSALVFGFVHLLNWSMGADLRATLLQVAAASLIGLAFTAPLAVTRNIWPLVFIHSLNNFIGYLTAGGFLDTAAMSKAPSLVEALATLIPWLLMAVYSFWLLRRAGRRPGHSAATAEQQLVAGQVKG